MNKQNKKKGGGKGLILVFLLFVVLPRLFAALEDTDLQYAFWRLRRWLALKGINVSVLPMLLIGLVILIVILSGALKAAKKMGAEEPRRTGTNTASGRTTAARNRPDPRSRSFTPPEPSCVVCDHSGEDHFVRDKAQRIAQLDEWLKNGLIEKDEYRVLKDRFERDL